MLYYSIIHRDITKKLEWNDIDCKSECTNHEIRWMEFAFITYRYQKDHWHTLHIIESRIAGFTLSLVFLQTIYITVPSLDRQQIINSLCPLSMTLAYYSHLVFLPKRWNYQSHHKNGMKVFADNKINNTSKVWVS